MPISKTESRRKATRMVVKEILEQIVAGQVEVYIGYRRLYGQWCKNNAALQELRPMFRIPGIEPDGMLAVSEGFKSQVVSMAKEVLPKFHVAPGSEPRSEANG
jgi:hypothetical protein